jgi:NAD(P)-dependent dehydrogenase (short-subunit alcohol dehydrogenase family)
VESVVMSTHDRFHLEGRVALVTGATSGLGGAMAEAVASPVGTRADA